MQPAKKCFVKNIILKIDLEKLFILLLNDRFDEFRSFITENIANDSLEKLMVNDDSAKDISMIRQEYLEEVCLVIFNRRSHKLVTFLKILFLEYDFLPRQEFIRRNIRRMHIDILEFIGQYFDLHKFTPEVYFYFQDLCHDADLEKIKKLARLGFDLKQLCETGDCGTYHDSIWPSLMNYCDPDLLKFLLDSGLDFKEYEREILIAGVRNNSYEFTKVLVEYGADLSQLNKHNEYEENDVNLYNLLADNKVDPIVIALLFRG